MEKINYVAPQKREWLSFDTYMLTWFKYTDSPSRFVVDSNVTSSSINDPCTNGEFLSFLISYMQTCGANYKGTYKYNNHMLAECYEDEKRLFVVLIDDLLDGFKVDGIIFYKRRKEENEKRND